MLLLQLPWSSRSTARGSIPCICCHCRGAVYHQPEAHSNAAVATAREQYNFLPGARQEPFSVDPTTPRQLQHQHKRGLWLLIRLLPGSCNSRMRGSLLLLIDYSKAVAAATWKCTPADDLRGSLLCCFCNSHGVVNQQQ